VSASKPWIRLPPLLRERLPNGLEVIIAERRALPLVTIRLALRAGSSHDPAAMPGLAAFTARLLRQGAGARDAHAFAEDLDAIGGLLGASIGLDQLVIEAEFTADTWARGRDLFLDALLRPRFEEGEVARERERALAEIAQSQDDPDHVADRAFQAFVFEGHPYAHPPEGTAASLARMRRDDLVAFHRDALVPDGGVLAVIGDVRPAAEMAGLRDALAAWPGRGAEPAPPQPAGRLTSDRCVLVQDEGSTQAQYRCGNVSVRRTTPLYPALVLGNAVLGGGFTSRLVEAVRVERGLTYGIGSRFMLGMAPGSFLVSSFTRNAAVREMHELIGAVVATMRKEGPTHEEMEAARAYVLGVHARRLETPEALAQALCDAELFGLGLDAIEGFRRDIEATTREACLAAMQEALPEKLLTVIVGDRTHVEEAARGFGDLRVVGPDFAEPEPS
jgi:zinc protease